jgi:hypothetical protein
MSYRSCLPLHLRGRSQSPTPQPRPPFTPPDVEMSLRQAGGRDTNGASHLQRREKKDLEELSKRNETIEFHEVLGESGVEGLGFRVHGCGSRD